LAIWACAGAAKPIVAAARAPRINVRIIFTPPVLKGQEDNSLAATKFRKKQQNVAAICAPQEAEGDSVAAVPVMRTILAPAPAAMTLGPENDAAAGHMNAHALVITVPIAMTLVLPTIMGTAMAVTIAAIMDVFRKRACGRNFGQSRIVHPGLRGRRGKRHRGRDRCHGQY
jgi:hypothetical protein